MTVSVSILYLREVATHQVIAGELNDAITPANLVDWQVHWQPAIAAIVQDLVQRGVPPISWPQSLHWNWSRKVAATQGMLAYRGFSVTCAGVTQGLILLDLTRPARLPDARGKPLVYVDYLEVAPWNWPDLSGPQRYKGVGSALITAATMLSLEEGFKGRLGLHSLPQSEHFYREICKMTDLGPDPTYQNLRYFEMTGDKAITFTGKEDE